MKVLSRVLAAAFLAGVAHPDDIVLKSGGVVQGKIDRAATEARNRGKTYKRDWVLVYTDEKGQQKEIPYEQVRGIIARKTPWEEREENLRLYEKKKQGTKNTVTDQEALGKWCKSKKLDEEARTHYRAAYQLRKEQIKQGDVEGHIALGDWARKVGLMKEAEEQFKRACEIKRDEIDDGTPDGFIRLARWLEAKGMTELAEQQYEEALKIDPRCAAARSALSAIRSTMEYKTRAFVAACLQARRAYRLTVAIEDNADKKALEEWARRVQEFSKYIFNITEGQFFIAECVIEDSTSNGKILVESGKLNDRHIDPGSGIAAYCTQPGTPDWQVHTAGKPVLGTLAHELFHGVFGLPDEYYGDPQCPCVMGSEGSPDVLCDDGTHREEAGGGNAPRSCWSIIKGLHRDVRQPNPDWRRLEKGKGELSVMGLKLREPPPVKIQIVDN